MNKREVLMWASRVAATVIILFFSLAVLGRTGSYFLMLQMLGIGGSLVMFGWLGAPLPEPHPVPHDTEADLLAGRAVDPIVPMKPCPFCGGNGAVLNANDPTGRLSGEWFRPVCSSCYIGGWSRYGTPYDAIEAWNKRT